MAKLFKVYKYKHPRYPYRVYIPSKETSKKSYKAFKTKTAADTYVAINKPAIESEGIAVATLDEKHRRAYVQAHKALRPFNLSVGEAVNIVTKALKDLAPYEADIPTAIEHYCRWNDIKEKSTTLQQAFDLHIEDMKAKHKSQRRIADQKSRLGRFKADLGNDKIVGVISSKECNKWLNNLKVIKQEKVDDDKPAHGQAKKVKTSEAISARTRNSYRVALSAFFNFCKMQEYIKSNPIEDIPASVTVAEEIEFYKPEEIRKMLNLSPELSDIRAYIAIGAFAGLRRSEIERLTFDKIDLEQRKIILAAKSTKTKQRRAVDICDNLAHWLAPYAIQISKGDKLTAPNFRKRFEAFRESHKIKWIENGLRHSYGTYKYALTQNEYETAKQMGNSPAVLKNNYANQLVSQKTAQEYFDIKPKLKNDIIDGTKILAG